MMSALAGCSSDGAPNAAPDAEAGASGTAGHTDDVPGQGDAGSAGDGPTRDGGAGGGGGGGALEGGAGGSAGAVSLPIDLKFEDRFVSKVLARRDGSLLVLLDQPLDLRVDSGSPQRELALLDSAGRKLTSVTASTKERFLLDFAVHDSNEVSVLYASSTGFALERFDAKAKSLAQSTIVDEQIDLDPPVSHGPPSPAIESLTRDAGRVAALGEQLIVATRTGRHSVVAFRFRFLDDADGARFQVEWRALVVPPFNMSSIGLKGGSYDTFGAVQAQAMLQLAVDDAGIIYVAVQHPLTSELMLVKAYARVFGEVLAGDPDALDVYVTRVTPSGARIGTTVIGTAEDDQLFGMRASSHSALVIGRKEYWNAQGTGFDALIAELDGRTGGLEIRELNVMRSDLAFDAAALADGSWLVTGASNWSQNPGGASVSEQSAVFLRRISSRGELAAIEVPNGPRHNEGRSLLPLGEGRYLVGGMRDGPGTHSGDADASLIRSSGFLREFRLDGE